MSRWHRQRRIERNRDQFITASTRSLRPASAAADQVNGAIHRRPDSCAPRSGSLIGRTASIRCSERRERPAQLVGAIRHEDALGLEAACSRSAGDERIDQRLDSLHGDCGDRSQRLHIAALTSARCGAAVRDAAEIQAAAPLAAGRSNSRGWRCAALHARPRLATATGCASG